MADTYNHKIKVIDPATQSSTTFLGSGEDGWRDGAEPLFDEPGGVSLGNGRLYIADTNNHIIRVASLVDGMVSTLVLADPRGWLTRTADGEFTGKTVTLDAQTLAAGATMLNLQIDLPDGYKFNDIAPFLAEFSATGEVAFAPDSATVQQIAPSFPLQIPLTVNGAGELQADLVIYYCEAEAESLCLLEQVRLLQPIEVGSGEALALVYAVPLPPGVGAGE